MLNEFKKLNNNIRSVYFLGLTHITNSVLKESQYINKMDYSACIYPKGQVEEKTYFLTAKI
ncbi:hypothetical protein GCM10007063_33750 [Lentibacillus kapialis]|uniref:Uncharacterized protein n=1 Tax=Lentibacillus kapialis TaxID=340214 RepID=A0A917Q2M3_9BACI|nr:hypothetical protein GCM10007063_33750 [Lentibacillus kapialis]